MYVSESRWPCLALSMRTTRLWQGVRMRTVLASPDPDLPPRAVTLPAAWDDRAACALACLAPGDGAASLAGAAAPFLAALDARGRNAGLGDAIAAGVARLLQQRRAAPRAAIWRGDYATPGFVLNVAAFREAESGFDPAAFGDAASLLARACRLLAPEAQHYEIGLAGLDDLLAGLGMDYDSTHARAVAACLAALFRARIDGALESDQRDLLAAPAGWPAPPPCPIPGVEEAARAARAAVAASPGAPSAAGVFMAGPVEALLGIETGGIAPAFSPVRDGHLSCAAQNRLASAAMTPEAALAAILEGDSPLPVAGLEAHAAMHAAVAVFLQSMPPLPASLPAGAATPGAAASARAGGRLPARARGLTQKASIAGHRVFLRTGEYADGQLGEVDITLPREGPAFRALMEAFAQAVTIGLQQGVPLEHFVEAFAESRFGPAGAVEGDAAIAQASSVLDYVFRSLAATYLGQSLPDPAMEPPAQTPPSLPLDLPDMHRRGLRLVA